MTQLQLTTAGESHGPELTAIVVGMPSGVTIHRDFVNAQLRRRQAGYGRSPRQRIEQDEAIVTGGVRHGVTMGSPIAMRVPNRDHANWDAVMSPWPTDGRRQGNWRDEPIHLVRPGHADLGGIARGGFADDGLRPVLERSSARETAARVAAGSIAQQFLGELGVRVRGYVRGVGSVLSSAVTPDEDDTAWDALDQTELRTVDADCEAAMVEEIDAARAARDTLGGELEIVMWGVPPGVGGYVTAGERLDGRLAGVALATHAMKSVTIGAGDVTRAMRGSDAHDEVFPLDDASRARPAGSVGGDQGMGVSRRTNRAGGIEGGMANGAPIVVRVGMKPLPTLMRPLASVDIATGAAATAHAERSDTCAIAAAAVALETALAFELAAVLREQFGAQAMEDVRGSFRAYAERVGYPHREAVSLA